MVGRFLPFGHAMVASSGRKWRQALTLDRVSDHTRDSSERYQDGAHTAAERWPCGKGMRAKPRNTRPGLGLICPSNGSSDFLTAGALGCWGSTALTAIDASSIGNPHRPYLKAGKACGPLLFSARICIRPTRRGHIVSSGRLMSPSQDHAQLLGQRHFLVRLGSARQQCDDLPLHIPK